jgi:hypothetical protein
MKRLLFLILLCAGAASAQATFDQYGGLTKYANGSTPTECGFPNNKEAAQEIAITSITGNGTTITATVSSSANLANVGNYWPIYITGVTNSAFNNVTWPGVLAKAVNSTTITWTGTTNATSSGGDIIPQAWGTQEISHQWWFCSPLGNIFQSNGVVAWSGYIPGGQSNTGTFDPTNSVKRTEYMGFNTLQIGSDYRLSQIYTSCTYYSADVNGICANHNKIPVILNNDFAFYSMVNETNAGCSGPLISDAVKDTFAGRSSFYSAYGGYLGIADYFDPNFEAWIQADLACDAGWQPNGTGTGLYDSLYSSYVLGINGDDSDYMAGISGGGQDFSTAPPAGAPGASYNTINIGMVALTNSPMLAAATSVAGGPNSHVYTRIQNYTKLEIATLLQTEYTTIGALNTAWSTSGAYTTFGSSGTCVGTTAIPCASDVAADSVGTGNGSTLTFSTTLSHTSISAHSVQVSVAGTAVAGDIGTEGATTYSWYGPNVASGTVNPSTGALTITFTSGHAPANGAAITAAYCSGCWGYGTGILDEDGRTSHQGWIGNDFLFQSGANANFKSDTATLCNAIAYQYLNTSRTTILSVFPNLMYFGPETFGTYQIPPYAPVLQAANGVVDAFIEGGSYNTMPQTMLNYVESNYGNHPMWLGDYSSANADSAINTPYDFATNGELDFQTQVLRGEAYYTAQQNMLGVACTSSGDCPYVGVYWWYYNDQSFVADGIVTPTGNAYNAVEPVSGSVSCVGVTGFTCGSEPAPASGGGGAARPYGNLLNGTGSNGVIAANALWYAGGSSSASGSIFGGGSIFSNGAVIH